MDKRIKTIAKHYGFEAQAEKSIEEMGELISAIVKWKQSGEYEDYLHMTEELVDVEIMVQQLKHEIYSTKDGEERYKKMREFKLNRQIERIGAEK